MLVTHHQGYPPLLLCNNSSNNSYDNSCDNRKNNNNKNNSNNSRSNSNNNSNTKIPLLVNDTFNKILLPLKCKF